VPALTCTSEDRITSEWVGLDGFSGSIVEQDSPVPRFGAIALWIISVGRAAGFTGW